MNDNLSTLLKINKDTTDFITVELNAGKDTLKISYYTENGFEHLNYKGKTKKSFFETHFSNTRIYIPALTIVNIDRLRVGSSKESDLLIYHYEESLGWILFFAAGSNPDECANSFSKFNPSKSNILIPYMDNHKWGFIDSTQQIVISPIYDFVRLFNDGVAKVKLDGKWGLINEEGKRITEIKYDKLFLTKENKYECGNEEIIFLEDSKIKISELNTDE
jgi:hypothetical protein